MAKTVKKPMNTKDREQEDEPEPASSQPDNHAEEKLEMLRADFVKLKEKFEADFAKLKEKLSQYGIRM